MNARFTLLQRKEKQIKMKDKNGKLDGISTREYSNLYMKEAFRVSSLWRMSALWVAIFDFSSSHLFSSDMALVRASSSDSSAWLPVHRHTFQISSRQLQ
jgi:hypothetical protein